MRALVTILGVVLTLGIAVGGLPAESRAADAVLSCPGTAMTGQPFTAEVTIDVAAPCTTAAECGMGWTCTMNKCTTPLGAYSIVLSFDPTMLAVGICTAGSNLNGPCNIDADCPGGGDGSCLPSVAGGHTTAFHGTPAVVSTTCPAANSCQTIVIGFNTINLTGPTGLVSVALVTFDALAAATSASIDLTITDLADPNGRSICMANGGPQPCSAMGCGLSITPGPTTTTSTTTTTTTTQAPTTTTTTTTTTTQPPTTLTTTSSTSTSTSSSTTTSTSSTSTTTFAPTTSTTTTQPPTTTTTTTTQPATTSTTTTSTMAPTSTTITSTTTTTSTSTTSTTAPPTTSTSSTSTSTSSSTSTSTSSSTTTSAPITSTTTTTQPPTTTTTTSTQPATTSTTTTSTTAPTSTTVTSTTTTTSTSTTSTTAPPTTSTSSTSTSTSSSTSTSTSSTTTTSAPTTSTTTTTRLPPTTTTSTTTSTTSTQLPTTTTTIPGNLPPDCSAAAGAPAVLWPPNHKFVEVSVVGVTDPDGDPVAITITGIAQDEAPNGAGAGDTCPDATGVGTASANLRAEREGGGDGRVYHISFAADDGRGGRCTGTVSVCVPHDQGAGRACGDQGPLFDSTGATCEGACTSGCAIEMAVAQPVCSGESLPRALVQRLGKARRLVSRAAGTSSKRAAKRLMRNGIMVLRQAARIAARAAKKGDISAACAASVAMELGDAETGADRWLRTR